jgi:protein TonB
MWSVVLMLFLSGSAMAQEDTTVYEVVDQDAQFPGGTSKLMTWFIDQDVQFEDDYVNGICKSLIILEFIVEKDGSLSNVQSVNTCALSQEKAIALMKTSPLWSPAILNSKKVRSQYRFPIRICYN